MFIFQSTRSFLKLLRYVFVIFRSIHFKLSHKVSVKLASASNLFHYVSIAGLTGFHISKCFSERTFRGITFLGFDTRVTNSVLSRKVLFDKNSSILVVNATRSL